MGAVASLDSIFAQEAAVGWLRSAYASGRLPHGLLFSGPAGVGKWTTAVALAGLHLCRQPRLSPSPDRCGRCDTCALMDAETHPDFRRVYRQLIRQIKDSVARDLSVDVIREYVVMPAGLTSQMDRGKVFVIEEAERMSAAAQNALLKTLEEPPVGTLLILLTDTPGALLPTIRSRCQPVRFRPIPDAMIVAELERRGVDRATAEQAARQADGSLGTALRYVEDGLLPVIEELVRRMTATLVGKADREDGGLPKFLKEAGETLAERIQMKDPEGSKDQATREALAELMRLGENGLRRLLRGARTQSGMETLCRAIETLMRARDDLESNVAVGLALQNLAAQLEPRRR